MPSGVCATSPFQVDEVAPQLADVHPPPTLPFAGRRELAGCRDVPSEGTLAPLAVSCPRAGSWRRAQA